MSGQEQPIITTPAIDPRDLFEGGPPRRLTSLARLPTPLCPNTTSRMLLVVAIGWLPLWVATFALPALTSPNALSSLARDASIHARFAIAAPLLVLAYAVCARRLGAVAHHFLASGLLDDAGKNRFEEALQKARRRVDSRWAEVATLVLAYALVFVFFSLGRMVLDLADWQVARDGASLSPAGWWYFAASLPLLHMLLIGWFWRIVVWTLFLRDVARLDLRLVATHPDQAAGLGFLAQSVRAFTVLGLALGTIGAGRFAQLHLEGLDTRLTDGLLVGGTIGLTFVLCVAPLLTFSGLLLRAWRDGALVYGALATEMGARFERKWLTAPPGTDKEMLSEPDFSAATDFYQQVANVHAIRFAPVDLRSLVILAVATVAPFIPAMFLSMPAAVVLRTLTGLIL